MTNYVSYTSKKLLTSWVETVRNFSWIYKFSLRREQKRITKYVSKSYTKRLLQWVRTWTPDLKLQLPMRKLKVILHTNQLEGLSTSRHATRQISYGVLSSYSRRFTDYVITCMCCSYKTLFLTHKLTCAWHENYNDTVFD